MKQGWEYKKLGEIITPAKAIKNCDNIDYPILSITMRNGIVLQNERFKKTIASVDTSNYKIVKNGQLVIAFPIDEGLIYTQNIVEAGIMSPAYNIWDVDFSKINRHFLVTYLHCPYSMNYYKSKLRGTTMRRRSIPKEDLLNLSVPIPPMNKQMTIMEELDKINELIRLKKEQLKDYDNLAQSIFYEMFGDPVENEMGWEVKKLGEVCTDIKYGTSKPACENGRYKYLRMCNLTDDGFLDLSNLKTIDIADDEIEKCIVRYGDILFNRTNSIELVGKTCMFDKKEPMVIAGYIIRVRLNEALLPIVLAKMFNLTSIKKVLRSMAKGAVNQANINSKELASIKVPLPPLPLQQLFAQRIEQIERQKAEVQKTITDLETLLASRMQYWFE